MKKTILSLGLFLGATLVASAADPAAVSNRSASYQAAGKTVVKMIIDKKVDTAEVAKHVDAMVADAVWLANEYASVHPKGAKLLQIVTGNIAAMKKLSFKDLEHEWHDLHHFDKITDLGLDVKAEENEHFTDPIHAIVHPILVLKAAQNFAASKSAEDLKAMKEEMEEGLEQVEKMKAGFFKKIAAK